MKSVDKELISNFNSEQHRMVVNIIYTAEWINNKVVESLKEKGLTHVQYNILRILLGSVPQTLAVGDIKKRLINKKADVTRLLDRLTQKDLIERNLCSDNRRQIDVSITKKGMDMMEELSPMIKSSMDDYFKNLISSDQAQTVNKVLDQIRSQNLSGD